MRGDRTPTTVLNVFSFANDEPEAFDIVSRFVLGDMSRDEFAYELAGLWHRCDGPFLRMVLHAAALLSEDDETPLLQGALSACMRAEPSPVYGVIGGVAVHALERRTWVGSTSATTVYVQVCAEPRHA